MIDVGHSFGVVLLFSGETHLSTLFFRHLIIYFSFWCGFNRPAACQMLLPKERPRVDRKELVQHTHHNCSLLMARGHHKYVVHAHQPNFSTLMPVLLTQK